MDVIVIISILVSNCELLKIKYVYTYKIIKLIFYKKLQKNHIVIQMSKQILDSFTNNQSSFSDDEIKTKPIQINLSSFLDKDTTSIISEYLLGTKEQNKLKMKEIFKSINNIFYFTVQELDCDEEEYTYMVIDINKINNSFAIKKILNYIQEEGGMKYSVSRDRPSGKIKSYNDLYTLITQYMYTPDY
jgi:hypothetical protein